MTKASKLLLLFGCVLTFSAKLTAEGVCTTATITGTYGYRYFGYVAAPDGSLIPMSSLGVARIYRGDVSAVWSQSVGGEVHKIAGTGKVTVNPDCTGSLVFEVPGYVTFETEIVILDEGKEIHMMPVKPDGFVLTGELRRMSPAPPSAKGAEHDK